MSNIYLICFLKLFIETIPDPLEVVSMVMMEKKGGITQQVDLSSQ